MHTILSWMFALVIPAPEAELVDSSSYGDGVSPEVLSSIASSTVAVQHAHDFSLLLPKPAEHI